MPRMIPTFKMLLPTTFPIVMAAFAAGVKIDAFAYMPVQDFGNAFSTFIAQNYGARKNVWTVAKNTWEKGLTYAYRDRRNKKRNFRALWIQRINAAARLENMTYSTLMGALHKAGIEINRKVLADLAVNNPEAFKAIVAKVK